MRHSDSFPRLLPWTFVRTENRSRLPTCNRMGWISRHLNPISAEFVEFCTRPSGLPVLDIGAGFGTATLAALAVGARVIANDLEPAHLAAIAAATPEASRERLTSVAGSFPDLDFAEASLAGAHASSVFHFLTGRQIDTAFRRLARWLAPGGKIFIQAATPYQQPFLAFLPTYRDRVAEGAAWPGRIAKLSEYCRHRQVGQMPRSIHLLDDVVLARAAERAGLIVERAWLYEREDLPKSIRLDGREAAGLIARVAE
jgi:SAM-dependent methyltransferase